LVAPHVNGRGAAGFTLCKNLCFTRNEDQATSDGTDEAEKNLRYFIATSGKKMTVRLPLDKAGRRPKAPMAVWGNIHTLLLTYQTHPSGVVYAHPC